MDGSGDRIGIIAGTGSLPGEVARLITSRGGSVYIIMVDGAADPALAAFPHTVVNWAALGHATAALKRAGIGTIIVLGGFQRPSFRNARPDFAFFRTLPAILRLLKAGGDDAVLRGLLGLFESEGLKVVGIQDVARELLLGEGCLTKQVPSPDDRKDIETGFALVAALGRYDIGQGAVVAGGRIEAIEGAEGTDRMLTRVGDARRADGGKRKRAGVLVKRPKPGQDLRVDLPAIGPDTSRNVSAAGLAGVAVMANHVLTAERSEMTRIADERGLFIAGIAVAEQRSHRPARDTSASKTIVLGTVKVGARAEAEIARASGILAELAAFSTGSALVVRDGRVLAIGADEPPVNVIRRVSSGRKGRARRRGLVAIGPMWTLDEDCLVAARDAALQGVVKIGASLDNAIEPGLARLANEFGLFVAVAANPDSGGDK